MCFTTPSPCSWLDHPVSGLLHSTLRHFKTRFRFAYTYPLKLAKYSNSLTHYTKGTPSRLKGAPTVRKHPVSGLFHSPLGVLFTFPSRYSFSIGHCVVLRLGGWSPLLQTEFLVLRPTRFININTTCTGLSPSLVNLPRLFHFIMSTTWPSPISLATTLGVSFDFLSYRYLDVSVPCVRLLTPIFSVQDITLVMSSLIRISADQSSLSAPHSFSQTSTSFFASQCQGIHRMPFRI